MSPQHDIRLEVDANASNHGNGGEGNGFEVLMVIMEEKGSGEQVRLGCLMVAHRVAASENLAPPYMIGSMM